MLRQKKILYMIVICIMLLIIDQTSKLIVMQNSINTTIIPNILQIQFLQNKGGAFGIGQNNTNTFIITNIIVIGLIIRFICINKNLMDKLTLYTLLVIIVGGIGNLIDRLSRGYVIDFINIFPKLNFPRFNLADMYITIGWVILAFAFAIYTYKELKNIKKKE